MPEPKAKRGVYAREPRIVPKEADLDAAPKNLLRHPDYQSEDG